MTRCRLIYGASMHKTLWNRLAHGSSGLAHGSSGLAHGSSGLARGSSGLARGSSGLAHGSSGLARESCGPRGLLASALLAAAGLLFHSAAPAADAAAQVRVTTNMGDFVIELLPDR